MKLRLRKKYEKWKAILNGAKGHYLTLKKLKTIAKRMDYICIYCQTMKEMVDKYKDDKVIIDYLISKERVLAIINKYYIIVSRIQLIFMKLKDYLRLEV